MSSTDGSRVDRYLYLSNTPPDTYLVELNFGHRNQLFDIYAESKNGNTVAMAARYDELSKLLSELYGQGTETVPAQRWFGRDPLDTPLKYTEYASSEVKVTLLLLTGVDLHWAIHYQNLAGPAEFQADHRKKEMDAL